MTSLLIIYLAFIAIWTDTTIVKAISVATIAIVLLYLVGGEPLTYVLRDLLR